jgi:hypothetical protein
MTKGLSFAVPYDPQFMFVIIITIIIKNWSCKARERERKTYLELLLKDEDNRDGGLANQCYFLPLYFCFLFTSPLFLLFSACFLSFFFLYLLFPLSLSVIVPLCLSLYYLCLFIFRLCFFVLSVCGSPLLCGFSLFVLVSLGLYLVGWINNLRWGEVEVPFCWRKVTSLSVFSKSMFFFPPASLSLCVVVFIRQENAPLLDC